MGEKNRSMYKMKAMRAPAAKVPGGDEPGAHAQHDGVGHRRQELCHNEC